MSSVEFGPEKSVTPEIRELADQVKGPLEEATGRSFDTYMALKYRAKEVRGMMYLVKVQCDDKEPSCFHLMIYQAPPSPGKSGQIILINFQPKMTRDDPINYF